MLQDLIQRLLAGDRHALSQLVSLVERQDVRVPELLQAIAPHTGRSYCVGVTGPPGSGKSTLVDALAYVIRQEGRSVGILAVDPTSPYTGGAVLGDRIRMQRHYLDHGVFIRSMASRGSRGGIAAALMGAVQLLDAAGKDMVLVETAGVGQSEIDVTTVADTVVVVLVPEAGDAIQTMKAGLMEAADIFVVNKADREGAAAMVNALKGMLSLGQRVPGWTAPVVTTQAQTGDGVPELYERIQQHRQFLASSSQLEKRRRERRRLAFLSHLEGAVHSRIEGLLQGEGELAELAQAVERGEVDPISAAEKAAARVVLPTLSPSPTQEPAE
ncbi:MAG: methylmalonyl Co-A mutase-associated GTPase MeaB [Dehalococcoidia bacterium]|nr:methylmalonyl Co-A mutase-associated GTPase MeaB [Dehalococcoidia bacterium]